MRCTPSVANVRTVCAVLATVAQTETLARTTTNRILLESARSALHDYATSYSWIGWWWFRRHSYRNDHTHLRYNRHPDSRYYSAPARQRHTANFTWNLTFHFVTFCLSKIAKIIIHISHYLARVSNHTNTWMHICIKSSTNIPKTTITQRSKLALFNTLKHITYTWTAMDTALQNSLCIPNMTPPHNIQNGPNGMLKFNTQWTWTKLGTNILDTIRY